MGLEPPPEYAPKTSLENTVRRSRRMGPERPQPSLSHFVGTAVDDACGSRDWEAFMTQLLVALLLLTALLQALALLGMIRLLRRMVR